MDLTSKFLRKTYVKDPKFQNAYIYIVALKFTEPQNPSFSKIFKSEGSTPPQPHQTLTKRILSVLIKFGTHWKSLRGSYRVISRFEAKMFLRPPGGQRKCAGQSPTLYGLCPPPIPILSNRPQTFNISQL